MTPLERIARAICEQAGIQPDDLISMVQPYRSEVLGLFCRQKADSFRPAWQFFLPHATAALEALNMAGSELTIEAEDAACDPTTGDVPGRVGA